MRPITSEEMTEDLETFELVFLRRQRLTLPSAPDVSSST